MPNKVEPIDTQRGFIATAICILAMASILGAIPIFVAMLIWLSGNFDKGNLFEALGWAAICIAGPVICLGLALLALMIVVLNKINDKFLRGLTFLAIAISALLAVAGPIAFWHPPSGLHVFSWAEPDR